MPQALAPDGSAVDVAPENLVASWKAGDVELVPGASYSVKLADGRIGSVPAEHMADALDKGATPVGDDAVQAYKDKATYGGATGIAEALAGGALEQGTLGIGQHLLPEAWRRSLEASQEAHPYAAGAGQIAGAIGLGAVLPGGGLAGLAEKGGAAALEGVGESTLGRIAARAAIQGAKGAAEGAQFGTAQSIAEAANPDADTSASHILANIGGNALWGAGLGAGFSLLGEGVSAARGRPSAPAEGAAATEGAAQAEGAAAPAPGAPVDPTMASIGDAKSAEAVAGRVLGEPAAEGLGNKVKGWYDKISSVASGKDKDEFQAFTGGLLDPTSGAYQARQAALEADELHAQASRAIRAHVDDILSASEKVTEEARGTLKRNYVKAAVADVDPAMAAQASRSLADETLSRLQSMADNTEDFGGERDLGKAIKITKKFSAALDKAIADGDVGAQFSTIDDIKRAVGTYTKGTANLVSRGAPTDALAGLQNKARFAGLSDLYEHLRTGLEDGSVWKKAAEDQQAINAAWTGQIDASSRFHRAMVTQGPTSEVNPWMKSRIADPAKIDSYVKNLSNPLNDLVHQDVTKYVQSTSNLADIIGKTYELPGPKAAEVARLKAAAGAFQDTLDTQTKNVTLANQYKKLTQKAEGHGWGLAAAALGSLAGAPGVAVGAALGKIGRIFSDPAAAIGQAARIEQMARDGNSRIGRALRNFTRGGGPAPGVPTLAEYPRRVAEVTRAATSADTAARMASMVAHISTHSPKVADAMVQTSLAGLRLLQSKTPAQPPSDPMVTNAKPLKPSPQDRETFLRYYHAVRDPLSVLENARRGRLSTEGVEVLQTVYPKLYSQVQSSALDAAAAGKFNDMTQQQRVGMALLLDLPTPELAPDYIRARQQSFADVASGTTPQGPNAPPTSKRTAKIDLDTQTLASDRVEGGMQGE